jgi:hypothetical protein
MCYFLCPFSIICHKWKWANPMRRNQRISFDRSDTTWQVSKKDDMDMRRFCLIQHLTFIIPYASHKAQTKSACVDRFLHEPLRSRRSTSLPVPSDHSGSAYFCCHELANSRIYSDHSTVHCSVLRHSPKSPNCSWSHYPILCLLQKSWLASLILFCSPSICIDLFFRDELSDVKREIWIILGIFVIDGLYGRVRWFITVGQPSGSEKRDLNNFCNFCNWGSVWLDITIGTTIRLLIRKLLVNLYLHEV